MGMADHGLRDSNPGPLMSQIRNLTKSFTSMNILRPNSKCEGKATFREYEQTLKEHFLIMMTEQVLRRPQMS